LPLRAALAAGVVVLVAACSRAAAPQAEDVRPVRAVTVAPAATTAVAEFAGEVRPRIESRIGFQVAGRITARSVEVGQTVTAGQALATLDAADYKLSAAAAAAQLAAAEVERNQQRADYKRFEELHQQGFISGADLERRRAARDAAEARFEQAAAQKDVSGNQAGYAVLRAPASGVVTAIDAEIGQVVSAGQSVVRIAQTKEKEVVVALPENRLDALRRIPDVKVTLWTNGAELRGRVREIAPIADAATRTFPARITLLDAPSTVALGMTAYVRFEAPLPAPVIALPLQSLLQEGGSTYVWRFDRGTRTVSRSAVQVANVSGNDVVVASGVAPGDTIVTAGVHLLKEGQKVRLLDAPLAGDAPQASPTPLKPKSDTGSIAPATRLADNKS
jgi:RND family efflux transporter MFP subunit